ncbi:tyrosine-type recombinase/integrase [Streptomyces sp. B1-3]|uniref:tyrosine-type recombinase/integrase n=1 Tax=Streptomyces sp. B1-3 TaxID=3141453 RepID=UPI003D29BA0F
MADVYDRWHLSRPRKGARPCAEHSSRTRTLVASADHGTGKRWQVRYRDARGEQRAENFEKKGAADARAAKIKADLDAGQFLDRAAGRQTFRALGEDWRTSAIHRDQTESRVERTLRLHLYPTFGERSVVSVKRSEVQAWVKGQAQRYEASTVAGHFEVLNTVMRTAVLDGAIRINPCDGVTLPEVRRQVIVPHLLVVQALIEAAPPRYRALVALAASSGMRQGELFGLEEGLDFLRRRVDVFQQLKTPDKGPQYLGQLKTPESYREVPLAGSAVTVVSVHVAQFPPATVEIEDRTDPLKPRTRSARLLFTDDGGRPMRRSTWSRIWKGIKDQAEAELKKADAGVRVPDKCTLHSLRDFYATSLIKGREDVKTVQVRLGHSKPSITLDKYVGYWPTDEDTTASVMESVLGPVLGPQGQVPEPSARVVHGATATAPRSLR